ncbi:cre-dnj-16 protein [Moniliophthora roreri]|uniref:J domain-containing protein n=1 Tax=Moniliophthora roreri TaxID=221103 RepID=A0A0W0FEY3_MONRR|nr:cre-dnj-16 protein [Moniliophthora roreri]
MLSYALSTASTYFHLPVDEDEDKDILSYERKYLTWTAEPSGSSTPSSPSSSSQLSRQQDQEAIDSKTVHSVLANDDLYQILGVSKSTYLDKLALRRAYLSRSRACHPDKFPPTQSPAATLAFQKVAIAYNILSNPSSRRQYDSRPPQAKYDVFAVRPTGGYADETFRGAVLGVFNDFLDGDMEIVRTFLRAVSEINPSLSLGDEGINSVLIALQSIRERALSCRTCIFALHGEFTRLLETQHALRQLPYFDLFGRSRLTIRLTRITLSIPVVVETALVEQKAIYGSGAGGKEESSGELLPRQLVGVLRALDVTLERLERILK